MTQRIPALDGLRGLAIAMVVLGHLRIQAVSSLAPLGVTLFFVLSGFLITGILTRQADAGGIRFVSFYRRRARRLVPALVAMLAVAAVLQGSDWWTQTWQALLYVGNWLPLHGESLGNINHVWSLAVEEHFYVVWPLVVALIPARKRMLVVGLLTLAFGMWRLGLAASGVSGERLYYATDTNAFALLAGCWISVGRFPKLSPASGILATLTFLGFGIFGHMDAGLLFASIPLAAVMVHVASQPFPMLEVGWLRWLGTVSYGVYLWHALLPPAWMIPGALVLGWLSWVLIERPILEWKPKPLVLPSTPNLALDIS